MPASVRKLARRALARLGVHVDHVGAGTYTVRREPWPGRFRLVDSGPHTALLAPARLSAAQRWQRDKRLFNWVAERELAELLTRYAVDVVLDVGANVGQYGQLLRRIGYAGHIVSFEPVPACFAELSQQAAGDERWTAHNLALGRADGTADMHVTPNTLSSMLPASEYGTRRFRSLTAATTAAVPVRRLDGLLDEVLPAGLERPNIFLKMDTQGYDLEAFAGLGERHKELVGLQSELALLCIYEHMPRLPEALAVYEAAGFEVAGLFPVNRDGGTLRILEYDCLMVRA